MSDITYGIHSVDSLIQSGQDCELVILKKENINSKINDIVDIANSRGLSVKYIENLKDLPERINKNANHQNIFAVEKDNTKTYNESDIVKLIPVDKPALVLVLDSVQDPHNFGACIRSAYSAGVDFIIVPKDNSSPINATVKKVACGAVEYTKIVVVTNLARSIETLKKNGVWVTGLAGEASESLYDMTLNDSIAIVAGAEGKGMRQRTKSTCDFLAKLPMLGKVSSLNVSVATGIALYEAVRQRGFK
jgi:23S rRNA (guanosine2251-2'-O)-methyltransferase